MRKKTQAGKSFVMLNRELLLSPSWLLMSINCKRLIDFLFAEHLSKGGFENGHLKATYDQLASAGVARRLINRTISEAEAFGLIRVERGGRKGCVNHLSTFLLTFLHTFKNGKRIQTKDDWKLLSRADVIERQRMLKIKTTILADTATVSQTTGTRLH